MSTTCGDVGNDNGLDILLPVGRAFATLLYASGKLEDDSLEETRRSIAAVVFSLTSLMAKIMDAISIKCLERVTLENDFSSAMAIEARTETPKLLTNLLLAVMNADMLKPSLTIHRSFFEGIAYLVLQRTGHCLSLLVYGRRTDDAGQPLAMIEGACEDDERRAMIYESAHLGQLVMRVAALSPYYLSFPGGPKLGRSRTIQSAINKTINHKSSNGPSTDMHKLLRHKLQKTLTSCIFQNRDEEGDEFLDCLRLPGNVLLKEPKRMSKDEKQIMGDQPVDWFLGQVWGAVGWQILCQEDDL